MAVPSPGETALRPQTASSRGTVLGTPQLHNCEPVESRLRRRVQGCWRELLRECKERDPHRQGDISAADFLGAWPPQQVHLGHSRSPGRHQVVRAGQGRQPTGPC